MANYLVAKVNSSTTSYSLRNTEPSKPYLRVSNSYLPLTTQTKTGLQVKVNNVKYNIQESYSTTIRKTSTINWYYTYTNSTTGPKLVGCNIVNVQTITSYNGYNTFTSFITSIFLTYGNNFTASIYNNSTTYSCRGATICSTARGTFYANSTRTIPIVKYRTDDIRYYDLSMRISSVTSTYLKLLIADTDYAYSIRESTTNRAESSYNGTTNTSYYTTGINYSTITNSSISSNANYSIASTKTYTTSTSTQ